MDKTSCYDSCSTIQIQSGLQGIKEEVLEFLKHTKTSKWQIAFQTMTATREDFMILWTSDAIRRVK
jgi:hypothetical protein